MRPMLSRRTMLPAIAAVLAATGLLTAPAQAADEFTCNTTASLFAVRSDMTMWMHEHNEPETGADSWVPTRQVGSSWPSATWAGPDGRFYYIHGQDGTLQRHRWLGDHWENGGVSKPIINGMEYWHDPANAKKLTVDPTGAFYLIDANGVLRRRTYDENSGLWQEIYLDGGWHRFDAIFAAGEGVLWAREPSGAMFRFRYHAGSQRWLSHGQPVPGIQWERFKHLTSPGADIIYGARDDNALMWFRFNESTGHLTSGTVAGGWWTDSIAATAAPGSCRSAAEPNPQRPDLGTPDRLAKTALLKTTNGHLQYAYVDTEGRAVHAQITDLYNVNPNGFTTLPDTSGFTGTPALGENTTGELRLLAQAADSDVRGFGQSPTGTWNAATNDHGRMLTPPQAVRTNDNRVTYLAMSPDGQLWAKWQHHENGLVYPWRLLTAQSIPVTKHFTAIAQGNAIHVIALRADGAHCKTTIAPGSVSDWACAGQSGVGAAAVVPMPDNTLQLFARRTDGKIYTTRTSVNGSIPASWAPVNGSLPGGVLAAGDPAALMAPDGTIQLVVRGDDNFTYRTGQLAAGSPQWTPWSEVTQYREETAVDPTLSLAANTWVVAFRTPGGVPQLWRFHPAAAAARTAGAHPAEAGAGDLVPVPLKAK